MRNLQILSRNDMKNVMAGDMQSDCELYRCCNSAGSCTNCAYMPGGVGTCGSNDTKVACCWEVED